MGFLLLQLAGAGAILILLVLVLVYAKKTKLDWFLGSVCIVLVVALLLVLFPEDTAEILQSIGFSRPLDAFLTLLAFSGFALGLRSSIHVRKMRREITLLVRKSAIEEVKSRGRKRGKER